jgi:hypothetical protein
MVNPATASRPQEHGQTQKDAERQRILHQFSP